LRRLPVRAYGEDLCGKAAALLRIYAAAIVRLVLELHSRHFHDEQRATPPKTS
jgi:hypothetical protein